MIAARANFLVLSLVLAFLGSAVAWHEGFFHLPYALVAGGGLVLAHASVNILNNYFDFRSGIDLMTERTPFSGGGEALPEGLLSPRQVLAFGLFMFFSATAIGLYFVVSVGWRLLPLLLVAALLILLYSPLILKCPWPEWSAGAGLGAMPVLGMYFVLSGSYTYSALIASIPSALLVHNLLLLNEFVDAKADHAGGRRTLPIILGPRRAALFFTVTALMVYLWIAAWAAAGVMPMPTVLAFLTLPLAVKAIIGAWHSHDREKLVSAMGIHVAVVLVIHILISLGYIISA